MKRALVVAAISMSLSFTGFSVLSAIAPTPVGACGWTMYETKNKIFSDAREWLQVWRDGCGSYAYEGQVQNNTSGTVSGFWQFRIWVCGTFKGYFYDGNGTFQISGMSSVFQEFTPSFYYGSCSPQVDNYASHFGAEWYPATYLNY